MNHVTPGNPTTSAQVRESDSARPGRGPAIQRLAVIRLRPAAMVVGAIVAFAVHFRPWEVAFLEEWPLAAYWVSQGPVGFVEHYFEWSLSRPLHLVPTEIGLAITGGSPGGIFLVMGIVAAGQFVLVVWALRPVSRSFWLSASVAFVVALHPLWPGGFLQRFLPAQTAALALIIVAGLLIRWLQHGRVRTIVLAAVVLLLGLCVYPGPAVAAPLVALVLAVAVQAPLRRRLVALLTIIASSAAMTLYSLVITRLINPGGGGYEAGNFAPATMAGARQLLPYLGAALLDQGHLILAGVFALMILGAVLALVGAIPHWAGWLISATALVSPLCAVVFFGNVAWLQDIDRIGYATSLGLIAALAIWPITSLPRPRLEGAAAIILAIAALAGAASGVQHWQPYIQLQHRLFAELAPVVHEATGDEVVVVIDHSGTYGSAFTLPQYYISSASQVMNDDPTTVWLCYLESDPPLDGATVCDSSDTGDHLRLVRTFGLPTGNVDIYIGEPRSDG